VGLDLTPAAPAPEWSPDPGAGAPVRRRRGPRPGAVLAWASVAPALAVTGWLLTAYPLALAGHATPLLAVPAAVPVIGLLLVAARRLPAVPETPWWPVLGSLAVAAVFAAYTAAHSSGHVVLRRDSAVYALLARWIADSGSLVVPSHADLIGAPDATLAVAAPGLYDAGGSLTAQFMSGTALTLAPAGWGSGWGAVLTGPAVLGALGLLAVAGLAARLLGPRWAPVAALAVGLTQPVLLTARSTYSEPLAQLLLLAGMCLLLDAAARRDRGLGAGAGLALGISLLVRIDAVRDLALLVPIVAWLALRRNPAWLPLAGGVLLGAAYGTVDALGPSRAYVSDLWPSIAPALAATVALVGLAAVAVPVGRRVLPGLLARPELPRLRRRAAVLAAVGLAAVLGWLLLRPLVWQGRGTVSAWRLIEALQRDQGLPVDGQRNYAEESVRWVSWYAGWPALALAAAAAVVLGARAVRGEPSARRWVLGLGMPLLSALAVLWSPSITPDHPWADRRLVPTVLPVVALLALRAVAGAVRRAGNSRWPAALVLVAGLAAVLLPAEAGSRPLRDTRTEAGEPAAVDTACGVFGPGDVALMVDARGRQEWTAALREVCGVPAFGVPGVETDLTASRGEVDAALARIRAAGRRPVLVASSGEPLPGLTAAAQRQVVDLDTSEHQRSLTGSPHGLAPLSVELWVAVP
jgi:hypothetical protein